MPTCLHKFNLYTYSVVSIYCIFIYVYVCHIQSIPKASIHIKTLKSSIEINICLKRFVVTIEQTSRARAYFEFSLPSSLRRDRTTLMHCTCTLCFICMPFLNGKKIELKAKLNETKERWAKLNMYLSMNDRWSNVHKMLFVSWLHRSLLLLSFLIEQGALHTLIPTDCIEKRSTSATEY